MTSASILVVDDERLIRWSLEQHLRREGYTVQSSETCSDALQRVQADAPDLILLDVRLPDGDGVDFLERLRAADPDCQVILMTAHGGVASAVRAMKLGAQDYVSKPFDMDELTLTIRKVLDTRTLRREVARYQEEAAQGSALDDLIGVSGAMAELKALIQRIAKSNATTVLLQGESGTGKDLVARIIHYSSDRSRAPFLAVNCVALPEHLLESELFGHERGAFTDARAMKKGLFEQAEGGTVYLDEIGDMRLDLQGKLLRLIEEKVFRRIGGVRDIRVDARIIAATNRELPKLTESGQFRMDLYYRLKVFPLHLPTLRERREDVLPLARHFLRRFSRDMRREMPELHPDTETRLLEYHWPGNVRELRNLLERALILASGKVILPDHLPPELGKEQLATGADPNKAAVSLPSEGLRLEEVERDLVRQALEATEHNQVRAARLLGISRDALRTRMKKFGFLS